MSTARISCMTACLTSPLQQGRPLWSRTMHGVLKISKKFYQSSAYDRPTSSITYGSSSGLTLMESQKEQSHLEMVQSMQHHTTGTQWPRQLETLDSYQDVRCETASISTQQKRMTTSKWPVTTHSGIPNANGGETYSNGAVTLTIEDSTMWYTQCGTASYSEPTSPGN